MAWNDMPQHKTSSSKWQHGNGTKYTKNIPAFSFKKVAVYQKISISSINLITLTDAAHWLSLYLAMLPKFQMKIEVRLCQDTTVCHDTVKINLASSLDYLKQKSLIWAQT